MLGNISPYDKIKPIVGISKYATTTCCTEHWRHFENTQTSCIKPEWFKFITRGNSNGNSIKQHVHPGSLIMPSLELTRLNWGGNNAQLPRHPLCESLPLSETSLLEQEEAHLIRHKQHWNRKTPHSTQLTINFHSNLKWTLQLAAKQTCKAFILLRLSRKC